ncbi:hypothetical protein Tco_0888962 [Tanacetum coccineum]
MFTSTHPIIVPYDYDVEDAFSSTHSLDYTPALPDYFPTSPGNTSPDPSDDLSKYLLASLAISPFHDDPYMKVMQAYDATSNELPIPLPQAPIAPPTILPPSPLLPLSRIFNPRDFFLPEEIFSQAVNKSPTHYPCDSARTFRVILFSIHNDEWKSFQCHHQTALRSYALSWKPCQGDSLNLPDHRIHKDGDGDASFQLKSDSLPHAHAQTTKTYYKHQDSRIMKAQELKTKTSAQTLIYKIFLQRYQVYQGRLLASFQDDAKYEHVGQDTRSQGGKDDQDGRIKI